jgi:hypothetical protein
VRVAGGARGASACGVSGAWGVRSDGDGTWGRRVAADATPACARGVRSLGVTNRGVHGYVGVRMASACAYDVRNVGPIGVRDVGSVCVGLLQCKTHRRQSGCSARKHLR